MVVSRGVGRGRGNGGGAPSKAKEKMSRTLLSMLACRLKGSSFCSVARADIDRWLTMTPLGFPVDPLVKIRYAQSSGTCPAGSSSCGESGGVAGLLATLPSCGM